MLIQLYSYKYSYKNFLNAASIVGVSGVLLGSVLLTNTWAMYKENDSCPPSVVRSSQVQQENGDEATLLKIGERVLTVEESTRVYQCISDAGYNGTDFDFTKFSKWYYKKFLRFSEEGLGYDK